MKSLLIVLSVLFVFGILSELVIIQNGRDEQQKTTIDHQSDDLIASMTKTLVRVAGTPLSSHRIVEKEGEDEYIVNYLGLEVIEKPYKPLNNETLLSVTFKGDVIFVRLKAVSTTAQKNNSGKIYSARIGLFGGSTCFRKNI